MAGLISSLLTPPDNSLRSSLTILSASVASRSQTSPNAHWMPSTCRSKERTRALNRCDIAFYSTSGVYEHLLAHVKAHKDAIRV